MKRHIEFGKYAENLAASYFEGKGYEILARNYRHIGCELDLVVKKDATLVFVEVKARSQIPAFFENLLSKRKQKSLLRGSLYFLSGVGHSCNLHKMDYFRFDCLVVVGHCVFSHWEDVLKISI